MEREREDEGEDQMKNNSVLFSFSPTSSGVFLRFSARRGQPTDKSNTTKLLYLRTIRIKRKSLRQ